MQAAGAVLLLALLAAGAPRCAAACHAGEQQASFAYLGCFSLQGLLSLQGVQQLPEQAAEAPADCPAACLARDLPLTLMARPGPSLPAHRCWCAAAVPDAAADQLGEAACAQPGGPGAAVLVHHDLAATQRCRVVPTPLSADGIAVDYNQHNVEFAGSAAGAHGNASMVLHMQGTSGTRVQPRAAPQLYGHFEVQAQVSPAPGVVTAFYVRDSNDYNPENKGCFEEIDIEFLNAQPGVRHSVWLNSYHRGDSRGERLVTPRAYAALLGLAPGQDSSNTWLTYGFAWQPSSVTWFLNGRPLLTRRAGETVHWSDMRGRPFKRVFVSPDKPSHLSFSMWSDTSRFQFGGVIDGCDGSSFSSSFRQLRRIVCDEPVTAVGGAAAAVRGASNDSAAAPETPWGPTWLYSRAAGANGSTAAAAELVACVPLPQPAAASPSPRRLGAHRNAVARTQAAACRGVTVAPLDSCGGMGRGCPAGGCHDARWPGFCCTAGHACVRHTERWWSCDPVA